MKYLIVVRGTKEVIDYGHYLQNDIEINYLKLVEASQKKELQIKISYCLFYGS